MVTYACGWIGGNELILIIIVILLLFGGRKLPELARGLGKGIRDFRKATEEGDLAKDIKDVASEFKDVKRDVEKLNPKNALNFKEPVKTKEK